MNLRVTHLTTLLLLAFRALANAGAPDSLHTPGAWSVGVQVHSGFIMAHRPSVVYLQERHARAAEFSFLLYSNPNKEWSHLYNFPVLGLSYRTVDFGNSSKIGLAHCLYPQIQFPLTGKTRHALMLRFGIGVGYVEKPFDADNNYKNLTIGSHLNAAVLFGLQVRFFTQRTLQVSTGIDFFHLSNGAARVPNLGINLPSFHFGLIYNGGAEIHTARTQPEKKPGKHEPGIYYALGFNEKYPPGGPTYWISVINAFYQHTAGRKGLMGAGIDYIYDPSIPAALSDEGQAGHYFTDATRVGIYGSLGLRISRLDLLFQTGTYLHNKDKSDGDLYSRLCARFHINKHLFAGAHLKAHYGRADYGEWAIGYQF